MRKISFLMLMTVLFACFSANATDYYLIGGFNGWKTADAACKFTDKGDGTFVLNYNGTLTSGFKVNDGTWDNDDVNFGSNGSPLEVGTPYYYGTGGSSGNITMTGAVANPKVTLNPAEGTLLVEGQSGEVTVTYAIHGCLASTDWKDTVMTKSGDNWVANNVTVSNSAAEFGIRKLENGNQSVWYAASSDVTVSATTTLNLVDAEAVNIKIAAGTYSFTFNPSTCVLTITAGNGGGTVDPPTPPTPGEGTDLYLVGGFNVWTVADANYKFTRTGNDYSLTLPSLNGEFKIVADTWDLSFGGDTGGEDVPTVDAAIGLNTLWKGSSVNLVADNWTNVTLSFSWDGAEECILVTIAANGGNGDDPVTPPTPGEGTDLYLVGGFNDWTVADANYKFTRTGNDYSLTLPSLNGEFKIVADTWDLSFGGDTGGEDVPTVDAEAGLNTLWKGSSVNLVADNWKNVSMTFTWDGTEECILVTIAIGESAVETITLDGAAAEYFDLNGVRVNNAGKGIYIVRRGNKVSKEIVK